jgi:hypothetical protein
MMIFLSNRNRPYSKIANKTASNHQRQARFPAATGAGELLDVRSLTLPTDQGLSASGKYPTEEICMVLAPE